MTSPGRTHAHLISPAASDLRMSRWRGSGGCLDWFSFEILKRSILPETCQYPCQYAAPSGQYVTMGKPGHLWVSLNRRWVRAMQHGATKGATGPPGHDGDIGNLCYWRAEIASVLAAKTGTTLDEGRPTRIGKPIICARPQS